MATIPRSIAYLLLGVLGAVNSAIAQDHPLLRSQHEAQRVLERAVQAMGGHKTLKQFRHAHIELSSRLFTEGQGLRPDASRNEQPPGRVEVQLAGPRSAYQTFTGDDPNFRVVTGDTTGMWVHFAGNNTVSALEPAAATAFFERVRLGPQYLLAIINRPETLRDLGLVRLEGVEHHAIGYSDATGRQVTLYFDAVTTLPTRLETLTTHAQHGDQIVSVTFADYRDVDGISLAHRLTRRENAEVTAETEVVALQFSSSLDPALFARPEDATEGQPIRAPAAVPRALEVERLAQGIHLIPNAAPGYNVMYVVLDKGILILETPQSPQVSRDVIRTIRERHPDTAIRWAIPTHYHFDHSGGLYGYIEAGVPIVTTEGNETFVRRIAQAPRTIGDFEGTPTPPLKMETIEQRRTFGQGTRRVDLIDVGPNPHVAEILMAYLPAIETIFVADLYGFQGNVTPANQNALAFAERLNELDLEFDIVIPVHGQRATAEQFWEAIRLGREQSQAGGD